MKAVLFTKTLRYLTNPGLVPSKFLLLFLESGISHIIPDKLFLALKFRVLMKKKLNLKDPQTYNEKLQWLKLYDRRPVYTVMSDKYEVRKYIAQSIGEKYLIPLLGVWDNVDEIDFDTLPEQFVLKCTHDSGSIVICHDKMSFDIHKTKTMLKKRLRRNYYYHGREWCYKNITPRIIAEKYMADESKTYLKDYKIFCFGGQPNLIEVDIDRFACHKRNFYSPGWEYQPLENDCPTDPCIVLNKPIKLELMLSLSKYLSSGFPQLRIDWYSIDDAIYFGEFTLYDGNGFNSYKPLEWDMKLGGMVYLPPCTRLA
ncbi:MAG: hypothetical protein LBQ46_09105 [Treponema sp.]|jgi:hypothetical protein|nr:hypothetical protein [Treponema sp.]